MRARKEQTKPRTLIKAVPLIVVLIIVAFITNKIITDGLPQQFSILLESPMDDYGVVEKFDENSAREARQAFAGFWHCREASSRNTLVGKKRLELKKNGTIWMEKKYTQKLPSGKLFDVSHIIHGVLVPFGNPKEDTSAVVCDVLIIRQNLVTEEDTCYGESNTSDLWKIKKEPSGLLINGSRYIDYGEASLDTFFQEGIINTIDNFSIEACLLDVDEYTFLHNAVVADMKTIERSTMSEKEIRDMASRYYYPVLRGAVDGYGMPVSSIPDSIDFSFSVNASGEVVDPEIVTLGIRNLFKKSFVSEIESWRFPHRTKEDDSVRVTMTFTY
ncbi:MAG: hypothetical protein GF350_03180 [Chitinivibrionales bacterium]|nr:hypothetical protein [Chitinivibrionales bacterium]